MKKPTPQPPVNPLAALPQVGAAPAATPMPAPPMPKGKGPKKGKDFGFTKSK